MLGNMLHCQLLSDHPKKNVVEELTSAAAFGLQVNVQVGNANFTPAQLVSMRTCFCEPTWKQMWNLCDSDQQVQLKRKFFLHCTLSHGRRCFKGRIGPKPAVAL